MYVIQDPLMLRVVEKIKEQQKTMGKLKLKNTRKDYENSSKLLSDLGITKTDKQSLFDLIESDETDYE